MRLRVLPDFGDVKLADIQRVDLQDFVDRKLAEGLAPTTIDVRLLPLRAIYRRAVARGELVVNPCAGLELPRSDARRERIADPQEAEALIAALEPGDRALWATAMYSALRRGELVALRWSEVDHNPAWSCGAIEAPTIRTTSRRRPRGPSFPHE